MSKRVPLLYLSDALESAMAIFNYVENISFDKFCNDRKTYSAVIREFEIIGEAIGNIPEKIKRQYCNIAWQDIKDFRNILIHEYFGVDLEVVWNIIQDDLPDLLSAVNEILAQQQIISDEW